MIKQMTEQLLLPFRAVKKLSAKALCAIRGHNYPVSFFIIDDHHLYFCTCCGKELLDRTFDDLRPLPVDHDHWLDPEFFSEF